MNSRGFSLKPFPSDILLSDVKITGDIGRLGNSLSISYELNCPQGELIIPAPADMPARKDALWGETCFEFFLGPKNSGHYWEFNLSPAGHWNVYYFTSYRQGMQEEPAFTSLRFNVRPHTDTLRLSLELGLDKILPSEQAIEIAISAVIKTIDGRFTCWALTHPGQQIDFHRRDSFIVEL